MTETEAKILLNQAMILMALAILVQSPMSNLLIKAADEAKADVEKECK